MGVPIELVHLVRACASIAGCYLCASLLPEIKQVRKTQTTLGKSVQLLPILSMFVNCVLWSLYGLLANEWFPLVTTNVVGVGLSTYYALVFHRYSPVHLRRTVGHYIVGTLIGLSFVLCYPVFSTKPQKVIQKHIGYLAITACAVMFGSPLAVLREVCVKQSTDILPFRMIVAGVINSSLWGIYGLILNDIVLIVPNAVNLALGCTQLSLFCIYPSTKTSYDKIQIQQDEAAADV